MGGNIKIKGNEKKTTRKVDSLLISYLRDCFYIKKDWRRKFKTTITAFIRLI